jgi:putative acetyltransferase
MIVRRETSNDYEAVHALFAAVYSPGLLDALRDSDAWLPALSFVALDDDGEVAGHIAGARGRIGYKPALVLVPPSIEPDQRGRGVGQALMHAVLGAAEALGEPLVGVVGFPPEFYQRFGFRPAAAYAITAPVEEWQPSFLVRPLTAYSDAQRGTFIFPDPFLKVSDGSKRQLDDRSQVQGRPRRLCDPGRPWQTAPEPAEGRKVVMLARIWRGTTRAEDADAYVDYLRQTGLREYRATAGNLGAWVLWRVAGERAEFITLSFWESRDAIRAFAGGDIDRAVFYPEDDRFLVDRGLTVDHYEVEAAPEA